MITLKESIIVAYRSSAVACASAKAKAAVAAKALKIERDEKKVLQVDRDSPEFRQNGKRIVLWVNYMTAQSYAAKFFTYGSGSPDSIGVRWRLERLWEKMGYDIADLPDWEFIQTKAPKTVIAFADDTDIEWGNIQESQNKFISNVAEIPTTDFDTQFEEMFDLFVNDIWASEGMRRWTAEQANREGIEEDDLAEWDSIQDGAGAFFAAANACCVKLANGLHQYQNSDIPDEENYIAKYKYTPNNEYRAINGLWALEPSDLPENTQAKMENKHVTVH